MCGIEIAGRAVRALRHGMAGQPGFELMGPWDRRPGDSRGPGRGRQGAWLEAGRRALLFVEYPGIGLDTLASSAVYTGEKMKPFREWLTANHYEAKASIGGSFVSSKIEDYYLSPWELGYGLFVKFDHDSSAVRRWRRWPQGRIARKSRWLSTMCR